MDKEFAFKILDSREERSRIQKELLDRYNNTLISYTLNIPGIKKDSSIYRDIHKIGYDKIIEDIYNKNISILYRHREDKDTGSEGYIVVDAKGEDIKSLTCNIEEEYILGRIFDIDVFNSKGNQLSRTDIGLSPRNCLICHREARICIREKNHTYDELIDHIELLYKKTIDKNKE